MKKVLGLLLLFFVCSSFDSNKGDLQFALLKYKGGGDWYSNPTALKNLAHFCNEYLGTKIDPQHATVEVGSAELFNHPFVHMTGHGNVMFSDSEAENLRNYLLSGGFLHIDDNYGMDPYVRLALKKVFPEQELIEIPFNHEIYNAKFSFKNGLPKIHKHDDKPAQGFGILIEGRVVCFYSYECDLGDGWEDQEVHKDPQDIRLKALKMGANLVEYAFTAI